MYRKRSEATAAAAGEIAGRIGADGGVTATRRMRRRWEAEP